MHQDELFPGGVVATPKPPPTFVFEMTPAALFEAQTALDPHVFVESVLRRAGMRSKSDEEVQQGVAALADRLVTHFAVELDFATAVSAADDPRVLLRATILKWGSEAGLLR